MSSLKELTFSGCWRLKDLPDFGECMKQLSTLLLDETAIRKLPTSIGYLVGLECLKVGQNRFLVGLPDTINKLKSLRILLAFECIKLCRFPSSVSNLSSPSTLNLSDCSLSEECLPHDFSHLLSSEDLDLSCNPPASLPISIKKLPKLRCLSVTGCEKLRFLPELPSSFRELEAQRCASLDIAQLICLSKSCNISASADEVLHAVVFVQLIPGSIFPFSYFTSRGNSVLPLHPVNSLPNRMLGIDLCFQLETFDSCHDVPPLSLAFYWNWKRLTTRKMSPGKADEEDAAQVEENLELE